MLTSDFLRCDKAMVQIDTASRPKTLFCKTKPAMFKKVLDSQGIMLCQVTPPLATPPRAAAGTASEAIVSGHPK